MRILVRHIRNQGRQGLSYQEQLLQGAVLSIGRGTDQDVHLANLRVALAHAELSEGANGVLRLVARVVGGVRHNGAAVQSATLAVGDAFDIGPYHLTLRDHEGVDAVLEIVEADTGRGRELIDALRQRSRLDIEAAGLRKRPWAVGLALALAVLFLILPLSGTLIPTLGQGLRGLPVLPSDHAWSSGRISNAHAHIADQCERCHVTPFVPVGNGACTACHEGTPHHVEQELLRTGLFDGARCADCHHEHNGPVSIARRDAGLCTSCHADLGAVHRTTTLADAASFDHDHPPFALSGARRPPGAATMAGAAPATEAPGLAFSHRAHLRVDGIDSPRRGTVQLACADCHRLEPGGGLMAPTSYREHCGECHRLLIPGDVEREVPHGNVAAALQSIRDYFAAQALRGGYPNDFAPRAVQWRRRPGVEPTPVERADALAWAERSAAQASREMIAYTTCGVCHEATADGSEGGTGWRLADVAVPRAWMPRARFSHAQHGTMACADCHRDVAASDNSSDVLMPDIDTCRRCHGGENAGEGLLASTCVTCHDFHRARTARLEH